MTDAITALTAKDAAAALDGNEYTKEGSRELWSAMKEAGLVAVFGASDDLVEFRGAIDEEIGAYNGTTVFLTPAGLLTDCDDNCEHFQRAKKAARPINALWDVDGFSWRYATDIPHAKFVINEDGDPYCEGIVFALADVP
jgi:hypothetical protein